MKTVIHLIPSLRMGGAEKQLTELANKLPSNHVIEPLIAAGELFYKISEHTPKKKERILSRYYQSVAKPLILLFLGYRSVKRLSQYPADAIVIGYTEEILLITGWLKKQGKIKQDIVFRFDSPLAASFENGGFLLRTINRLFYKRLCLKLIKNFSAYISVTQLMIEQISQEFSISRRKVLYVPNFATIENGDSVTNSIEAPYFIYVGRLEKIKGVDLLIKAFSIFFKRCRPYRLLIVGSGTEEERLKKLAKKLEVDDYIDFIGFTNNVAGYSRRATACIVPSRAEAFGKVILEMMASSVLVVASDCLYGPRELVINNQTGLTFTNGSIFSLVKSMCMASGLNGSRRQEILQAALDSSSHYSVNNVIHKLKQIEDI